MKRNIIGILILATMAVAHAEIRLINGTGKALRVDVLSKAGQTRDVLLPPDRSLSSVLGGKLAQNQNEILVIKDANGKELERTDAQTNCVFAINNWGSGVSAEYLGKFQGRKSDPSRINLINATGSPLKYKFEYEDFSTYNSQSSSLTDEHSVVVDHTGDSKSEGEKVKASITSLSAGTLNVELEVGALYMIATDSGQMNLQRIW